MKAVPLSIRVCSAQVSQNLCMLSSPEHSKLLWSVLRSSGGSLCLHASCVFVLMLRMEGGRHQTAPPPSS